MSIRTQPAAQAIANIAIASKDASKKTNLLNDLLNKIKQPGNEVTACLTLGELGKLMDLSKVPNIIESISKFFKAEDEAVRTAASICLGNISVGSTDFFLEKVFKLVDAAEQNQKYLFLNTIREIILNNPRCLQPYVPKLLPLLLEQAKSTDEQIRGIVSENLGRLFVYYSRAMQAPMENAFKSANALERATVTKSFKYAVSKDTESLDLEGFTEFLAKMIGDTDIYVRRYALESLTAITHAKPEVVRVESATILKHAISKTLIDDSLIKEVDLGPFKHKIDDGIPIRKAAFALIDTMLEKLPQAVDSEQASAVAIKGLEDTAEECMIQCLTIILRLVVYQPNFIVNRIEPLIECFSKLFTKNIANVGTNDKAKNVMRSVIRVIEQLNRSSIIEGNAKFADFFREKINEIPAAKDIFLNIQATASRGAFGDNL